MYYRPNSNRAPSSDDVGISFPLLESWNPMTKVATVVAEVNGSRVLCRISLKILQKRFHASAEDPMRAVVENRWIIEAAARTLLENEAYEEDGSIVIRHRDI